MILCAVYLAAWALAIRSAWRAAGRTATLAARDQADLRRALHAHDQDMDDLTAAADLPPDEFDEAFRQWQARQ